MLFVIDFDGTLAREDSVDALFERFAAPRWTDVERDWVDGRITAVECMTRQVRMVEASRPALEAYFSAIALDPTFPEFYEHVSRQAAVAIVSDGLDYPIQLATRAAGLPKIPVFSNRLHFTDNGLDISFPHRNADCPGGNGVCKCQVARDLARPVGGGIVLVGDGKSDHCLARRADAVFAKSSLRDYCVAQGIPHHPFETFADVLAVVRSWGKRPPRKLSLVA